MDLHRARAHRGGHRGAAAGRAPEPLLRRRQELAGAAPAARPSSTAGPTPRPSRLDDEALHARGAVAGSAAAALLHPAAARGDRAAAGRVDAPGHHLHLQPQGLRRGPRRTASTPGCGSPRPTSGRGSAPSSTSAPPALADADLDVLGFDRFLAGLEAGVAAHHAGMVPPFKEAVEACFVEGLTKAVFATETLALGVNMPARSVVIERLTEVHRRAPRAPHPGRVHAAHRPGRAAGHRRDRLRHRALVAVRAVRAGGGARVEPHLRPALGVPAHLQHGGQPRAALPSPTQAHHLLNLSFAQFQADKAVVRLEARLERQQAAAGPPARRRRAASAATSRSTGACGPRPSERPRAPGRAAARDVDRTYAALSRLTPGRRRRGRRHAPRGAQRGLPQGQPAPPRRRRAQQAAHAAAPTSSTSRRGPSARVELPVPYNPNNRGLPAPGGRGAAAGPPRARRADAAEPTPTSRADPRRRGRSAPPRPTRWPTAPTATRTSASAVQAERVERELDDLRRQVRGRTESLARRFDRVLRLLEAWGYLDGWALTEPGEVLARTYHEADLLVAEAMTSGLLDDLDAPSLAALVSCFTYEHRGRERAARAVVPVSSTVRERFQRAASGSPTSWPPTRRRPACRTTRPPDAGFVHLAHAWAAGDGLADVLEDEDALGRRLRAQREAAHRPAAPDRRRRAGAGHRGPGPPGRRRAAPRRGRRQLRARGRRRAGEAPGDDPQG